MLTNSLYIKFDYLSTFDRGTEYIFFAFLSIQTGYGCEFMQRNLGVDPDYSYEFIYELYLHYRI